MPRSATKVGGTHIDPGLARRYATALYESARRRDLLARVAADIGAVAGLLEREAAFRDFLMSPDVLDEHKTEILSRSLGPRLAPLSLNFLHLLLRKRRFDHLAAIHDGLVEMIEADQGILRARVTTAIELKPALSAALKSRLEAMTGKTIRLELKVNPEILGGVVIQLHNQLVDGSLRRSLGRLRDELMAVRVV